jgi:hypothetical protein
MRRILLLILLIAVTVGIGFGIYFLFFRVPTAPIENANVPVNAPPGGLPPSGAGVPPTGVITQPPTQLPPGVSATAQGGLTLVTPVATVPTTGATLAANGTLSFYNRGDGKFYRTNPDGTTTTLSNRTFFNVSNATFDRDGNKAVLEFPDGSNVAFDFTTDTQVTLPKHWEDFDFSADGSKIAAKSIGVDTSNRFLVVANPDGSGARAVQELGNNADLVQVKFSPNNQIVGTAQTGDFFGPDSREVFLIGQNNENFKSIVVQGFDFRNEYSPSGNAMLYSVAGATSDYKPLLWIVDTDGDNIGKNRRSIPVNTWADKCTFTSESTVFCAVPQQLPTGAGLQPDIADSIADDIIKIDLDTGLQSKVATPEGGHTIDKLLPSPDGSTLFFTDKGSGTLNKIDLR